MIAFRFSPEAEEVCYQKLFFWEVPRQVYNLDAWSGADVQVEMHVRKVCCQCAYIRDFSRFRRRIRGDVDFFQGCASFCECAAVRIFVSFTDPEVFYKS